MFLKLAGAGKDGAPFPHSSFFKTLKIYFIYLFIIIIFFLQNTISVPTSSPTVQESLTLRRGWGRVGSGVGDWSEKVQDVGEGSGFEHHENPAGAAGGRAGGRAETDGPGPDTHWGAGRARRRAVPGGAGGMAWGCGRSGFPKNE